MDYSQDGFRENAAVLDRQLLGMHRTLSLTPALACRVAPTPLTNAATPMRQKYAPRAIFLLRFTSVWLN